MVQMSNKDIVFGFFQRYNTDLSEQNQTYYSTWKAKMEKKIRNEGNVNIPCGLLNIGNTCYFNVVIQILYHIKSVRKMLYEVSLLQSPFMHTMKSTFNMMDEGSLSYINPQGLFNYLLETYPDRLTLGSTNDFSDVFQLIILELIKLQEQSNIKEAQKQKINQLFTGRYQVKKKQKIEGRVQYTNCQYRRLYLEVAHNTFDDAFFIYSAYPGDKQFRVQKIYRESPKVFTVMLNRVTYTEKGLVKDLRPFQFPQTGDLVRPIRQSKWNQLRMQLMHLKQKLLKSESIRKATSNYLQIISESQLSSGYIQSVRQTLKVTKETIKYAQISKSQIDQELNMQEQILKSYQPSYFIFGIVLHIGQISLDGHYMVCLKHTLSGKWFLYNDEIVTQITYDKIEQYNQEGSICCLLYRQQSVDIGFRSDQMSKDLKNYAQTIKSKHDRVFENFEWITDLLENEHEKAEEKYNTQFYEFHNSQNIHKYFFSPMLHLIDHDANQNTCISILMCQAICLQSFQDQMAHITVSPSQIKQKIFKRFTCHPSPQYTVLHQKFVKFAKLEASNRIIEAYTLFEQIITGKKPSASLLRYFNYTCDIIFMKGVFYLTIMTKKCFGRYYKEMYEIVKTTQPKLTQKGVVQRLYQNVLVEVEKLYESSRKNKKSSEEEKWCLEIIDCQNEEPVEEVFNKRFQKDIRRMQKLIQIENNRNQEIPQVTLQKLIQQSLQIGRILQVDWEADAFLEILADMLKSHN